VSEPTQAALLARCDDLLPKIAYLSQDQWEASGCRCVRRAGHDGECACDCWIDAGKVVDDEAREYLRAKAGEQRG
jgi:hypothetical protein